MAAVSRRDKKYELIQPDDRIAVCISGGKDSMLTGLCMQLLQRSGEIPFETVFLVMNPGYNEINRQKIIDNAALLEVPIQMFETQIFDAVRPNTSSKCFWKHLNILYGRNYEYIRIA